MRIRKVSVIWYVINSLMNVPAIKDLPCSSYAYLKILWNCDRQKAQMWCTFLIPTSKSTLILFVYLIVLKDVKHIWNNSYLNSGIRVDESEKWSLQLIFQFLKQLERRSLKKSELQRDLNPWPWWYWCDAIPMDWGVKPHIGSKKLRKWIIHFFKYNGKWNKMKLPNVWSRVNRTHFYKLVFHMYNVPITGLDT